jgi:hypothetical protein
MRVSKFRSDRPSFTKETPSDAQLGVASNEVNRRNCWYDWATGCVGGWGLAQSASYVPQTEFGGSELRGSRKIIWWRLFGS